MSKHTPGPWLMQTIERDINSPEFGECYIVGANLGGLIGAALPFPTERDSGDFSRVESNARLIAAAPDLLAALEFYANPEIYKPHPHGPAFDRRYLSATAVAAISKAKAGNEVVK